MACVVRAIGIGVLGLLLAAIGVAAAVLLWAHLWLRGAASPLPAPGTLARALSADEDGPQTLRWINSASQDMPRGLVLDAGLDPTPEAPYRMSHPSFVLEWADGRILLIDVGMTNDEAVRFGRPAELLLGARPTEPHTSTATRLAARQDDVAGVVFSHLHTDHVEGIAALCAGRDEPLPVFGTTGQFEATNHTTRPGLELLQAAGCVELVPLTGRGPLLRVPGFPGVRVLAVAGHTPGSQVVAARVGAGKERFLFTGDVANARDGIRHDVPKPWLYSTFIVPEDGARLAEVRSLLRSLETDEGFTLVVPHDERAIEDAGVLRWTTAP